ncbi:MAG: tRNA (adenosine(37)-N6)-threonylcarbamoyltransferase complex ATPase subunit type 1 TsaE [Paracoccaceae bacterium]
MPAAPFRTITAPTETATAAFARRLAPALGPGDTLLLSGPIGAGKTHFARALIQERLAAAGRAEDVPSPTFTLVQTYDDGKTEIWHADLYRLTDAGDLWELGLDEAFDTAICLVEWPDRLGTAAPAGALWIDIAADDADGRRMSLSSDAPAWPARIDAALAERADA